MSSKYDVNAIRQKLKQSMSGKFTDPDEFKPDKAKSTTEAIKYRFFVLPPLFKGDVLKSGKVEQSMDQFFISHANHWINDKPYPCPRVWHDSAECKVCQFGFDLLKEDVNQKDEDKRRKVIKQWMPTTYNMVNIFFTNWKGNPEELRGKVKFYNASKTLFDQWTAALMRDDAGDPEDPQAYGVFFDESAGFVYELQVLKQGRQNSYKTSKFLPNGGEPMPMLKNKDGSPNTEMLEKLLKLRHNLWDKIEVPDEGKINKIFNVMTHGDDDDDDGSGGFDEDENTPAATESKKETKKEKSKPKDDDDEDVVDHLADDDDAAPDLDDSGDDEDSLADEAPLVDDSGDDDDGKEKEKVTAGGGDDDVNSEEIDDLLSQLDDDD
jgi:hypothetical protein